MTAPLSFPDGGSTLPQLLAHQARKHPRALSLRQKKLGIWQRVDWATYQTYTRRFALGLQTLDFGPGHLLAIAAENMPEWFYAELAAQALGGASVGLYPTVPWTDVHHILHHSRARIVVCGDQEQTDKVLEARACATGLPELRTVICVNMKGLRHYDRTDLLSFEEVLERGAAREVAQGPAFDGLVAATDPDDLATVIYTPGTSGNPKGVMLTHRNLLTAAKGAATILGLSEPGGSSLCYMPLAHAGERSLSMVVQLLCGSVVAFAESAETRATDLAEIAPRAFFGVPRMWERLHRTTMLRLQAATGFKRLVVRRSLRFGGRLADRARSGRPGNIPLWDRTLRMLVWFVCFRALQRHMGLYRTRTRLCGGRISPDTLRFFEIIGLPILEVYGMAETAGLSHLPRSECARPGHVGIPIEELSAQLTPDGELSLRGPSVFPGYLFDPGATERAFAGGWLLTGDIAEQSPEGGLRILHRKSDVIVTSAGKNVSLPSIESALTDSPFIREAVLLGHRRDYLAALIQIDLDTVGRWARARGISYTTYRSLAENVDVLALIEAEIASINARLPELQAVRKFALLVKELDHDDGELTATMQVRRHVVEARLDAQISELYGAVA